MNESNMVRQDSHGDVGTLRILSLVSLSHMHVLGV